MDEISTSDEPTGVGAVTSYLHATGVGYELIEHPATYTAAAEARVTGTPPNAEAKTVVLRSNGMYRLAVIPASDRLDLRKVRDVLGERSELRFATESEMGNDFPQFEVGAVPPLGPMLPALEIVDSKLVDSGHIVCSAGDHRHSVRLDARELLTTVDPLVADVCED